MPDLVDACVVLTQQGQQFLMRGVSSIESQISLSDDEVVRTVPIQVTDSQFWQLSELAKTNAITDDMLNMKAIASKKHVNIHRSTRPKQD